jgi:hypothetical protein
VRNFRANAREMAIQGGLTVLVCKYVPEQTLNLNAKNYLNRMII